MLGVEHVTTGGVLREAISAGTEAGVAAQVAMAEMGEVPDDVLLPMLIGKLQSPETAASGWLLDGFPRTAEQASALQAAGLSPDSLVIINVPQQVLLEQATQRRFDPETGAIYHLTTNPPVSARTFPTLALLLFVWLGYRSILGGTSPRFCPSTATGARRSHLSVFAFPQPHDPEIEGRLVTRSSDKEEAVLAKLGEYTVMEQALAAAFGGGQGGALVTVDGTRNPQEVTQQLVGMMKLRR
jgi:adenylate kinase family enzyme